MRIDVSTDPAEILRSRHLDVVPYAPRVSTLSAHLGIDLSTTLFALSNLPLCQPRDRHAAVRTSVARMIADQSARLRAAIPGIVTMRCGVLMQPGRVDVLHDVVEPIVSDALSILIDMPIDVADHDHISRIFSQTLGVAKRRKMEAALGDLTRRLRLVFPAADAGVIALKLSLAILGRDAMIGTFACTLEDMARRRAGRSWSAEVWPETPTRTGVPYIDRMALSDVSVGGAHIAAGGVIRAQLDRYESATNPQDRLGFFGAGAHVCLGRALTLDLWGAMAAALATSEARPQVMAFALRRDDVFHIPETFILEIDAP